MGKEKEMGTQRGTGGTGSVTTLLSAVQQTLLGVRAGDEVFESLLPSLRSS